MVLLRSGPAISLTQVQRAGRLLPEGIGSGARHCHWIHLLLSQPSCPIPPPFYPVLPPTCLHSILYPPPSAGLPALVGGAVIWQHAQEGMPYCECVSSTLPGSTLYDCFAAARGEGTCIPLAAQSVAWMCLKLNALPASVIFCRLAIMQWKDLLRNKLHRWHS